MAISEANTVRERTRREAIDEMLLEACNLARENDQAALRLRGILLGSEAAEEQKPTRPCRPGWLGEIADTLETMIKYLVDAAKALEEVNQEVASQTPASVAPPSRGMAPPKAQVR